MASCTASYSAMYLASVDDKMTVVCFFDIQVMAAPFARQMYPNVNQYSSVLV